MASNSTRPGVSTQIIRLADRIAADIRARRLRPGDPYLNAAETARMLRVSTSSANRALQLLEQRRLLVRRQRKGTFVCQPPAGANGAPLRRIHLVVHHNYLETEGLTADGVVLGLQGELPEAEIQFNFLPPLDEAEYVSGLINEALRSRQPEGFVLWRSSVGSQRVMAASGLPAVVSGTVHPGVLGLSSIDRDQARIGQLLVDHLLQNKAQYLVVLLRDRLTAGDHLLLDATLARAAEAGLGLDQVVLRCLPADEQAILSSIAQLLPTLNRRVGFLCRSEPLARGADEACRHFGLVGRRRPPIALADVYRAADADHLPRFAHTRSTLTPRQHGAAIAQLLIEQTRRKTSPAVNRLVPVELVA